MNLVASGKFAQTHVFKVACRAFHAAGWHVGGVRIDECHGRTCLHSTELWGRQPEQCLEFFTGSSDPHQTQLRYALQEARLRKGRHVIVFADRYEEGFWRIRLQALNFWTCGIKLYVVQIGDQYSRRCLEYLAEATGGLYGRIAHDKYVEGVMPALLEFVQ